MTAPQLRHGIETQRQSLNLDGTLEPTTLLWRKLRGDIQSVSLILQSVSSAKESLALRWEDGDFKHGIGDKQVGGQSDPIGNFQGATRSSGPYAFPAKRGKKRR